LDARGPTRGEVSGPAGAASGRRAAALGELFVGVLSLCRAAGLVRVWVIAIDGTKIRANASRDQNRSYESIVAEILQEHERTDRE
jgi:hypothetical protein